MADDTPSSERIIYEPSAQHPGWMTWDMRPEDQHRFNPVMGPMLVRSEGDGRARVRMTPTERLSNLHNNMHGGAILAFLDMAMFAGAKQAGVPFAEGALTVDAQAQFVAPVQLHIPLDCLVDITRETRNLVFVRGTMEQAGQQCVAWTGLLKKVSRRG